MTRTDESTLTRACPATAPRSRAGRRATGHRSCSCTGPRPTTRADDEFAVYRALPAWRARIAAAHTIPRETAAIPRLDVEEASKVDVPVLLLVGGDSPASIKNGYTTVAAALPDARVAILEGQQHIAVDLIPESFAEHVIRFLHDDA